MSTEYLESLEPEDEIALDLSRVESDPFQSNGAPPATGVADAVFVDARVFVEQEVPVPEPLWGSVETAVIPRGGLCILAGRPGSGKTTFVVDLACHLAAGVHYPPADEGSRAPSPWPVTRPVRVALIENEGPQEMFRAKLKTKLACFPHALGTDGCLLVQTWRWGSFNFADRDAFERARLELDEQQIDLVIGDPLSMLGPAGVGSPAETREFVQILHPLGLGQERAFLFLHHFRERVERTEDELARISGAWGGHLDTLLTLTAASSRDQARLAYPKLRWAKVRPPNPVMLGRVFAIAGYQAIAEEGDATILEPVVYEYLADSRARKAGRQGWQTSTEIATAIDSRRKSVTSALEGAAHLFAMVTGQEAKARGASSRAKLWGLKEWIETETTPPEEADDDVLF